MNRRNAAIAALAITGGSVFAELPTSSPAPHDAAPSATQASIPTPQQIVDRYVDATGGRAAYDALRSRRASGSFALPDLGIKGTISQLIRSDGNAVVTIDVPGIGIVRQGVTNGVAWAIHPTDGPKLLTGTEAETTRRSLTLAPETSLDGYDKQSVTGISDVNGRPAYELALSMGEAVRETRFYDVETSLLVKSVGVVNSPAGELTVTTFYTDYEDAAPIRMPMKVRQTMSGVSPEQMIEKVEHNVELPDTLFALPAEIEALRAATRPNGGGR
jgi:hypothetical protein